jgi:hypothetical protein
MVYLLHEVAIESTFSRICADLVVVQPQLAQLARALETLGDQRHTLVIDAVLAEVELAHRGQGL